MVMLQVEHVNRLFEEITTLRAANWVEVNSNLIFITHFRSIGIIKCHIYLNTRWEFFSCFIICKAGCHVIIAH